MNDNQRKQIDQARRESEEKSYCIDTSGQHSPKLPNHQFRHPLDTLEKGLPQ